MVRVGSLGGSGGPWVHSGRMDSPGAQRNLFG